MKYQKVLLIDDDLDDQEIFVLAVEEISSELKCIICHNSDEALRQLQENQTEVDVVFLDWNLPGSSGYEILMQLKSISGMENVPIIIFSTSSDQQTMQKAFDLGASDFITKPNRLHLLVASLTPILT
ncbi:response regulator [Flavobacterium agrisoli]|uniref:Response regulator n=1 Tax=Flavobacterium agrisoli TaxID=2793066 RepID=A0A934UK57_9FLAO|nr:response regulator [Flavobacterium agrisoli]MBK0370218.1 response regulator [Flavobacterium agrisoli]